MKKYMVIPMMVAFFLAAINTAVFANGETVNNGSVSAGGPNGIAVSGNVTGINNNNARASSYSGSDATGGSATLNYTERQQFPVIPQYQPGMVNVQIGSDTYGTSVAQFGNSDILGRDFRVWTMAKHRTKLSAMKKVEGSVSWDKMMDFIKAYPNIEKEFSPIGESEVYLFDSINLAKNIGLNEENFVGTIMYDTELSKEYFVPQEYLGEKASFDGSQLFGANVAVKLGEFYGGHFIASGKSAGFGGIFSTILNCISSGGLSAGIGSSGAKSSKVITTGAVYGLFRVEKICPPPVCPPPVVKKQPCEDLTWLQIIINDELSFCDLCKYPCGNNQDHRKKVGDAFVFRYRCTGNRLDLEESIKQYWISLDDFQRGWEPNGKIKSLTRNSPPAQQIARDTSWNMFWCILELKKMGGVYTGGRPSKIDQRLAKDAKWSAFLQNLNGREGNEAAFWFGRQSGMTEGPSEISELRGNIFLKLGEH